MIKVKNTSMHKTGWTQENSGLTESVIVTEGKLVLVEGDIKEAIISKYWDNEGTEVKLLTSSIESEKF